MTDVNATLKELSEILGFSLKGFAEGTISVPKRMSLPEEQLVKYLHDTLGLQSEGKLYTPLVNVPPYTSTQSTRL